MAHFCNSKRWVFFIFNPLHASQNLKQTTLTDFTNKKMNHLSPWEAFNFLMISPFFLRKLLGHYNPFWGVFLNIWKCHLWQPVSFTAVLSPYLTITLYQGRKWALLNLKHINLKENVEVFNACNRKIAIGRRSGNSKPTSAWLILFGFLSLSFFYPS